MEFQVNFHNNSSEKTQKSIPSFPQVGVKIKKSLKPPLSYSIVVFQHALRNSNNQWILGREIAKL